MTKREELDFSDVVYKFIRDNIIDNKNEIDLSGGYPSGFDDYADYKELIRLFIKNFTYIKKYYQSLGYDRILFCEINLSNFVGENTEDQLKLLKAEYQQVDISNNRVAILYIHSNPVIKVLKASGISDRFCCIKDEYQLLCRQLETITTGGIRKFQDLFGYTEIHIEAGGFLMDKLREIMRGSATISGPGQTGNSTRGRILYVTEYIVNEKSSDRKYLLGIRQMLYYLDITSTIPVEIVDRLKRKDLLGFIQRFFSICAEEGWQIVISERNPLTVDINIQDVHNIQYLTKSGEIDEAVPKIMLLEYEMSHRMNEFYYRYRTEARIERRRVAVLLRTWIMEQMTEHFRVNLEEKDVKLYNVNWLWGLNNFLYPMQNINSTDIEKREKYDIYHIKKDRKKYESFLKEIYGDKYCREYVDEVFDIPDIIEMEPGKIRHEDKHSTYLNVVGGERCTVGQPDRYENTIYMLGGCVFFGYAEEDGHTVASYLQDLLNSTAFHWRVVNFSVWGGVFDKMYKVLYDIEFKPGDIVLISYAGYMPLGKNYRKFDISTVFKGYHPTEEFYFNGIVHCNHKGYQMVAGKLYELLHPEIEKTLTQNGVEPFLLEHSGGALCTRPDPYTARVEEYLRSISAYIEKTDEDRRTYGAIVMNCNPFTCGHQYLIEKAAGSVDTLYIFVVQEDRSYFPFEKRFLLVKKGTEHLKNVKVLPSGNLIISTVTFPGYFLKEEKNDTKIDTSLDLSIFAEKIAPALKISKRFVGEEPIDLITRQYNETMKKVLPRYGIEVIEIPRMVCGNSVVSASRVREYIKRGDWEEIRALVPKTTYEFLIKYYIK